MDERLACSAEIPGSFSFTQLLNPLPGMQIEGDKDAGDEIHVAAPLPVSPEYPNTKDSHQLMPKSSTGKNEGIRGSAEEVVTDPDKDRPSETISSVRPEHKGNSKPVPTAQKDLEDVQSEVSATKKRKIDQSLEPYLDPPRLTKVAFHLESVLLQTKSGQLRCFWDESLEGWSHLVKPSDVRDFIEVTVQPTESKRSIRLTKNNDPYCFEFLGPCGMISVTIGEVRDKFWNELWNESNDREYTVGFLAC